MQMRHMGLLPDFSIWKHGRYAFRRREPRAEKPIGFYGVKPFGKRFRATVKMVNVGLFATEEEAAMAVDKFIITYRKDIPLNFPDKKTTYLMDDALILCGITVHKPSIKKYFATSAIGLLLEQAYEVKKNNPDDFNETDRNPSKDFMEYLCMQMGNIFPPSNITDIKFYEISPLPEHQDRFHIEFIRNKEL